MTTRSLLLLTLVASVALAQEPSLTPTDAIRVHLHDYYRGERLSGFVPFVGSGVGSLVAGSLLLTGNTDFGRGAGWVNLSFGVLEVVAGLYFALSSYGKERALDEALTASPADFARSERERVARITNRFQPILLAVEGALSVGGGAFAGVGALRHDELMLGLGVGFAIQGLVMFLLDWAVLDRASAYATALSVFRP
jgi:hypothetical protein